MRRLGDLGGKLIFTPGSLPKSNSTPSKCKQARQRNTVGMAPHSPGCSRIACSFKTMVAIKDTPPTAASLCIINCAEGPLARRAGVLLLSVGSTAVSLLSLVHLLHSHCNQCDSYCISILTCILSYAHSSHLSLRRATRVSLLVRFTACESLKTVP